MTRPSLRALAALVAVLLSLSCLGPLFAPGGKWVTPAVIAAVLAAACGTLGRKLPVSALSGAALVLIGGTGLLTAVAAPRLAYAGVIPSGQSVTAVRTLISNGFADIRSYAPPVHASPGLILVTTAAVFLVGVVVDLFAVGADRPALAGVPLLGLVAVPAAFRPHGLGVLHLGLALLGWLLLLALEGRDRMVRWGRPLGRRGVATTPLLIGGAAGRVAGLGLVAAFALPLLVPALHGGIIHPSSSCCAGGAVRVVAPFVTVDQELHQSATTSLLSVSTNHAEYLRFTALDYFDGTSFTLTKSDAAPGQVNGPLSVTTPGLGPSVATIPINASINVFSTLAESYLPLPYSPESVSVKGNWKLTPILRTVFSTTDTTAGLNFSVFSAAPDPTKNQLRALPAGYSAALTAPALAAQLKPDEATTEIPPSVDAVVRQVTAGKTTAYDKLIALQTYFTDKSVGGFHYTLTPSPALPRGPAAITAFLKEKQGFCQQFASVFTLMARSLGLPARVAVGFTPGALQPDGSYLVDSTDAHAWPEVWFTGVGWVRFEPTPRLGLGTLPPYLTPKAGANATSATTGTPAKSPTATPSLPATKTKPDTSQDTPKRKITTPPALAASSSHGGIVVVVVVLVLVLLALAVPGFARASIRRRRERAGDGAGDAGASVAHAMWEELLDTAVDLGYVLSDSETPRATGRRLADLVSPTAGSGRGGPPVAVEVLSSEGSIQDLSGSESMTDPARGLEAAAAVAAIGRVREAEERARYAPPGTSAPTRELVSDVHTIREAMFAGVPAGRRLRARVLPASVLDRGRRAGSSAGAAAGTRLTAAAGLGGGLLGRLRRRK